MAEEDLTPIRLFFRLDTQWRVHPATGSRLGLNYAVIPSVAAMMEVEMTPALFDDLREMEGAALAVFAGR